ncbi:Glycosyl transferase family 2 [Prevotellaceae bacterium HUN156]|nr:Glycosyl transferase family 2 [Prevotellaceae bacterium HUN156]
MGRPKVSISVPVYNAENYLRQCLDSLVNQTLQDIEIIIVNDGSTDSSESICNEYAEKDSRVKLISKENGGSASARQVALESSTGEYICACDADDWVEPRMCELLYKKAVETSADIVMCDYVENHSTGKVVNKIYPFNALQGKDILSETLLGHFPHMIWNKIIRRELFINYNLYWENGINHGEDMLMCMKLLNHDVSIAMVSEILYHYRIDKDGNSYTHNITLSTFNQSRKIVEWAESNFDNRKYKKGLTHLWVNLSITGLRVKSDMTSKMYNETVMDALPLDSIMKYEGLTGKGIVALLTKLFGYRFGRIILKQIY